MQVLELKKSKQQLVSAKVGSTYATISVLFICKDSLITILQTVIIVHVEMNHSIKGVGSRLTNKVFKLTEWNRYTKCIFITNPFAICILDISCWLRFFNGC